MTIDPLIESKGRMTSSWTLDNNNQTTAESVGYSWSYDWLGRVVQQTMRMDNTDYTKSYSYSYGCGCSEKDLQSITYPDNSQVNYVRDDIGRVTAINPNYVSDVDYDLPDGSASSVWYGSNGTAGHDSYAPDSYGRISSKHIHMLDGYPQSDREVELAYTYSLSNRISRIDSTKLDSGLNTLEYKWYTYSYDRLGRLASETLQSGGGTDWSNSWSYDRYGNLTGTASDQTNRLTAYAGYYDASGNQLRDASNSFLYDANNMIKQANRVSDNALLGAYRYDGLGRRVKKSWSYQDNGQTRSVSYSYVYGAKGEILIEYKKDSTPSTVYEDSRTRNIYMGSTLVARSSEGTKSGAAFSTTSWPRRNHRQEEIYTVSISSGQVQISDNLYSRAFGSAGSDQFPGQKADDETGLKDFGARYYNASLMRWTSADSVTAHIYDPQSLNKYAYVRNDPINKVDPDGKYWIPDGNGGWVIGPNVWPEPVPIGTTITPYVGPQQPPDIISQLYGSAIPFSHDPTQATNGLVELGIYTGYMGLGPGYQYVFPYQAPNMSQTSTPPAESSTRGASGAFTGGRVVSSNNRGTARSSTDSLPPFPAPAMELPLVPSANPNATIELVIWYLCSDSKVGAIESWMETGLSKGFVAGAIAGFGAAGVATFGVGCIPGALIGGFVGGTAYAGAGIISGTVAAEICSALGVYKKP